MQRVIKAEGRRQQAEVVSYFCLLLSAFCLSSGADCTAISALACGTTAASLTSSDCTASDGSQYRLWQFSGKSGDSVTIEMHSTAFDTYLALLDPSGVPVADSDDAAAGVTDSTITFTLTTTGTWTVVANSLAASQTGNYTISLSCPSATTPRRRAVVH
ncbi:MAG: hypothetical protein DMF59_12365 [Acidobacteria bacterium]|nr:MAG: hypothetical protein DMF59_12365 [Acidobacteriota bacterium]